MEIKENQMRQIVIETDGSRVRIAKADVVGLIEFNAILKIVAEYINKVDEKDESNPKSKPIESTEKNIEITEKKVEGEITEEVKQN